MSMDQSILGTLMIKNTHEVMEWTSQSLDMVSKSCGRENRRRAVVVFA